MDLNEVAVFVKVVEVGSFAGAAHQLEMPKSTVSAKVSALEKRLGVTLIRRTTRKLFVTDAGQDYYQQCVHGLEQIVAAEELVAQRQSVPHGLLRVTAPVEMGGSVLPLVIREFQKKFPEVEIELILSDRTVDLVSEGIDLAIRAGELKDSSLIAKKLGSVYFAPFVGPKYLRGAGTPKSPKDLKEHQCIHFTPLGAPTWNLSGPKGTQSVTLVKKVVANDLYLIKSLAMADAGVALLPTFFCQAELRDGNLIRVLGDWRTSLRPVHFIYPQQKFVPKKLSAFLQVATDIIRQGLAGYET